MRKIILLGASIALFACTSTTKENGYTVNVKLTNIPEDITTDTLVLSAKYPYSAGDNIAIVKDGTCQFKGNVQTPNNYMIYYKGAGRPFCKFFLENEVFEIDANLADPKNSIIEGGVTQSVINTINKKADEIYTKFHIDSLMKEYRTATEESKVKIRAIYDEASAKVKALSDEYIKQHPTSFYALDNIKNNIEELPSDSLDKSIAAFKALPEYNDNKNLKEVDSLNNIIKSLQPGNLAPDFSQEDPEGKMIKFSDIYSKNKVTMVDFWASWCGPCRAFNPTLVKIYNEYHKKGFEILGVSFDNNKEAWIKGIKDDKLTWPQVSDLKGWQNAVGDIYYVRFVPQNIFVNQEGKIIARQASEAQIEEILKEYCK